jgi:hypothetical protein
MLIKGQDVSNITGGNTLSDDGHSGRKFDYGHILQSRISPYAPGESNSRLNRHTTVGKSMRSKSNEALRRKQAP